MFIVFEAKSCVTKVVEVAPTVTNGPVCKYDAELAASKLSIRDDTLQEALNSWYFGSIAAIYSVEVTSATEWPLNESTIIPFLNLGRLVVSSIVKSCLLKASCSSKDNDV